MKGWFLGVAFVLRGTECLHLTSFAINVFVFYIWILDLRLLLFPALLISFVIPSAVADVRADVKAFYEQDMTNLYYAEVIVEVEGIIYPRVDAEAVLAEIFRMATHIAIATPSPAPERDSISAIKHHICEPGYWNGGKAFSYDHDAPWGLDFNNRMLSDYLVDGSGNCITMIYLFITIGQRIGLDLRPSTAPLRVFVRFTGANGESHDLGATSGAGKVRGEHHRNLCPITDLAVQNRVYLARLSKREAIAVIAVLVLEHLIYESRHFSAMVKKGTAAYHVLRANSFQYYQRIEEVPEDKPPTMVYLQRIDHPTFDTAELREAKLKTRSIG